ncbi:MAG: CHAP domain-containing protein [Oscillospiraceae bacterium]|nr:CHAP domain-containing protein [Oscillospiraceae bacterium]
MANRLHKRIKKCLVLLLVVIVLGVTNGVSVSAAVLGDDYPRISADGRGGGTWGRNKRKDCAMDKWGMYNRECVSFVAWRLSNTNGVEVGWGVIGKSWTARSWKKRALEMGVKVNDTPAVGAVAWWASNHVAWVAEVNGNMVTVEEYNYAARGQYHVRTIPAASVDKFLHFKDLEETDPAAELEAAAADIWQGALDVLTVPLNFLFGWMF